MTAYARTPCRFASRVSQNGLLLPPATSLRPLDGVRTDGAAPVGGGLAGGAPGSAGEMVAKRDPLGADRRVLTTYLLLTYLLRT